MDAIDDRQSIQSPCLIDSAWGENLSISESASPDSVPSKPESYTPEPGPPQKQQRDAILELLERAEERSWRGEAVKFIWKDSWENRKRIIGPFTWNETWTKQLVWTCEWVLTLTHLLNSCHGHEELEESCLALKEPPTLLFPTLPLPQAQLCLHLWDWRCEKWHTKQWPSLQKPGALPEPWKVLIANWSS